jgi:outer membrane protein TolC
MRFLTAIFTLFISAPAFALTPDEALRAALADSPKFQETSLSVKQSEVQVKAQQSLRPYTLQAEGGLNYAEQPSSGVIEDGVRESTFASVSVGILKQFVYGTALSVSLDFSRATARIPFTVPDFNISEIREIGPNYAPTLQLQVTQPLLKNFGEDVNNLPVRAAEQQLEAAQLQRLRAGHDLAAEVLNAYWRWARTCLERDAVAASLERTRQLAEFTVAQIEAGQLAELERDIVQQRVSQAEQSLLIAESSVVDAWQGLERAIGRVPGSPPPATPEIPQTPAAPNLEAALQAARASSPDLALLKADLDAATLQLVRSRNLVKPDLSAVARLSQGSLSEDIPEAYSQVFGLDYTSAFLGLNFTMPLDNGLADGQLTADLMAVERAELRRKEAELTLEQTVRQAERLFATQARRVAMSNTEITLARKNVEAFEEKYRAGLASYLELLDLQRSLEDAEIRNAQARVDVLLAHINLLRVTGGLLDAWNLELR